MDILIFILISFIIGIVPFKKIFIKYFFEYKEDFNKNYDLKKCYNKWGVSSYFFIVVDFLKGPIAYIMLNMLNIDYNFLILLATILLLQKLNLLGEPFQDRGLSFFMGLGLIINLEIFKIMLLLYVSILILSRYNSIASFFTGAFTSPIIIVTVDITNLSLLNITFLIFFTVSTIKNYKDSCYHIFSETFSHI